MEDAVKLQTLYPGSNASHIAKQQETVVKSWTSLQDRSAHRREALQASCDLHRFLAQVNYICKELFCFDTKNSKFLYNNLLLRLEI